MGLEYRTHPSRAILVGYPGLGNGNTTWNGPANTTDFDIVFGNGFTLPTGAAIDFTKAPSDFLATRFVIVNESTALFTPWSVVAVSPTEVEFFAPAGAALNPGDNFFVNVMFTKAVDPTTVGFIASYSSSPVPLPPSVLLMAPGLLGLVGLRKGFFA